MLEPGSLSRRLASDSFWIGAEIVASRGGMLLAMLVTARQAGAHDFGGLIAVQSTVTLLSSIVSHAMRLTASSELVAVRGDHNKLQSALQVIAWSTVTGGLVLTAACAVLAGWLATIVLARPELHVTLLMGSLLVLVDCLGSVQLGVLTGFGVARHAAFAGIVASIVLVVAVAAGGALGGMNGAMCGLVFGGLIGVLLRGRPVGRLLRTKGLVAFGRPSAGDFSLLRRVSVPLLLLNILWMPANWLATIMLVRSPDGYVEAGQLGAAYQWFAALLFLPNVLGFSTLPLLSQHGRDSEGFARTRRLALHSTLVAALPLALITAAASPVIMGLYGSDYRAAWPVLVLLALASVPAAVFSIQANVLTATGRHRWLVGAQLAWAIGYVAASFTMLRFGWGASALAGAMLAGNLLRVAVALRAS